MKVSNAAVLTLAAVGAADLARFLNTNFDLREGEDFTLKYTNCDDGECSIFLYGLEAGSMKNFGNLTCAYHSLGVPQRPDTCIRHLISADRT